MRFVRRLLVPFSVALLVVGLLVLRNILAPADEPPPVVELTPEDEIRLVSLAEESTVPVSELVERIGGADVLLVGEVHFYRETMGYLMELIRDLEGRQVSLLLELPAGVQSEIDAFLETGDETILDSVFQGGAVLPYRDILVWARQNRERVPVVIAMDENRARIVINRALLRDTRNETMADHVLAERERHPANLVIAYGGQLHLITDGRYRFDVENRVPMGARLVRKGIPRERIVSLMLSGDGEAPLCDRLDGERILSMAGPLGEEPYALFLGGKIFRVESARDLFDYFVDLGSLTPVGE